MINKTPPFVSIIILNWNGTKYLYKCIESVFQQSFQSYEVIFVDNHSTDGSYEKSVSLFNTFKFVRNEKNYGFAKGMNIGIDKSQGEYILLLNTDVYLEKDYLQKCVDVFLSDSTIGCVAGQEFVWELFNLTDVNISSAFGIKRRLQLKEDDRDIMSYVFGVSGSFPVFRRETIQDMINVSGYFFDEAFGTGWEDTDIRFRLFFRNWTTKCVQTKAWHVGSAAAAEQKKLVDKNLDYQIRIFRNRFYVQYKYIRGIYPKWNLLVDLVNFAFPFYLILFHRKSVIPYFRGYFEYRANLSMLRKSKNDILNNINREKRDIHKYIIGI